MLLKTTQMVDILDDFDNDYSTAEKSIEKRGILEYKTCLR